MHPFRADHVGSLLRPQTVLDARAAVADGHMSTDELRAIEDAAIDHVLRRQREIGLDIVTDGELRRASWLTELADAVEGFTDDRVMLQWKGPGGAAEPTTARVAGAVLRKRRKLTEYELPFLEAHAGTAFKVTLPAPSNFMMSSYKRGVTDAVYRDRDALLADLVAIVRDEVSWLLDRGVVYIQFDAPYYSHYLDDTQRQRMQAQGIDPDQALGAAVAGDNAVLAGLRGPRATFALHVCRGNNQSRWYTEGAYDAVAETLFAALDVDRFLLEYDDERSGGFEPLRLVPDGKMVVLGLVTTKHAALESPETLRRRIDAASRLVPLDRLAISPQCGFASVARGNRLSEDEQWRKLELVVSTARAVWGS
jgi:5-methyltetrahydropteroyltriglutamate--homocysteine methyltransferase